MICLLSMDCKIPYRNIASSMCISANADKTRVNKMVAKVDFK
jgi:hypothetical protein